MEIPPVYWTLLGEIAAIFIGVLIAVIIVVLRDRKKLREYTEYLKQTINKLKKKFKENEEPQNQERELYLLKALINTVGEQYKLQYGNEITPLSSIEDNNADDRLSTEKLVLTAGFQMMTAQLSALENSKEPDLAWEKIKNELTPLFHKFLQHILSQQQEVSKTPDANDDDDLKLQLENAAKHINNLEKFKQLYFELQSKLSKSVLEIENLNEKIAELSDGSEQHDAIQSVIEKNKAVYLEMGQMIGMDKEQHHESVANTMDYSETIISERKEEIKRLKSQIAQQFEDIWALQSGLTAKEGKVPDAEVLSAGIETLSHNLKDAEMCIETMDMEIQTQCSEISNLRNQLKQHRTSGNEAKLSEYQQDIKEKEITIARFAQENKELMSCISGLESSNMEQSGRIKKLEEQNAELKAD